MTDNDTVQPSSVNHPEPANSRSNEPKVGPPIKGRVTESKPAKIKSPTKFGKANPVRDSILLVTLIGILVLLSPDSGEPKKKTEVDDEADNFLSLTAMLQNLAKEAAGLRRKDHCSLFLHTGSIPNTGLSYFAGRNYTTGEIILEDYQTLPVNSDKGMMYSIPSALVLKHHPILYNIQGVLYYKNEKDVAPNLQLRTSKAIKEGDELFVQYDPLFHINSIFNHVPTNSHYNRTKEIVADALRSITDQSERSGRVTCRMVPVMRFVKQIVARYDPMVATLLPESNTRASHYRKLHPSVATLRNSTLLQLQQMGVCLDDIVSPPNSNDLGGDVVDASNLVAVAQRNFSRGSIVSTLPLYILNASVFQTCGLEPDCTPVDMQQNCFLNENMTSVLFCPLGPRIVQEDADKKVVNVEYRWSQHRGVTEHFAIRDEFKYSTSILAWDVIALRDITIGEKLIGKGMPPDIPDHFKSLHSELECNSNEIIKTQ